MVVDHIRCRHSSKMKADENKEPTSFDPGSVGEEEVDADCVEGAFDEAAVHEVQAEERQRLEGVPKRLPLGFVE